MCDWKTTTIVPGSPADVLDLLTEPDAIAEWAPIPFEILELDDRRLRAGSRALVAGRLAGYPVEFEVSVRAASTDRLELVAEGPVKLNVEYRMRPADGGTELEAAISVRGRGLLGRLLATATEALLAAGALGCSLERLGQQGLRPALAA
jgi:uncharacterized protein YndB with AHSA1/START domain